MSPFEAIVSAEAERCRATMRTGSDISSDCWSPARSPRRLARGLRSSNPGNRTHEHNHAPRTSRMPAWRCRSPKPTSPRCHPRWRLTNDRIGAWRERKTGKCDLTSLFSFRWLIVDGVVLDVFRYPQQLSCHACGTWPFPGAGPCFASRWDSISTLLTRVDQDEALRALLTETPNSI
jgi:hypothetical protein